MIRALRLLYLRSLARLQLRTIMAVVAVAAGSSLALSVVVVRSSVSWSLASVGTRLAGPAPLRVVGATSAGGLEQGVEDVVARTPGVAAAVPVVQVSTVVHTAGGHNRFVVALGVDCRAEALIGQRACAEAVPSTTASNPGSPPLMATSALMGRMLGPSSWMETATGVVPVSGALRVSSLDQLNGGSVVVMPLGDAQALFARGGRLDAIYVLPLPSVPVSVLQARLAQAVGPQNAVLSAAEPPPEVGAALAGITPLLTILAVLAAVIAGVLVYNVVSLSLEERRRDHALAAALGAAPSLLVAGPLTQAAIIGAVGGIVGAAGGGLLAAPSVHSLSTLSSHAVGIPVAVHTTAGTYLAGLALGLLIGVVAAARPVRRAMRSDVVAEISGRDRREEAGRALSVGKALAIAAVALGALGVEWVAQRHGALVAWEVGLVTLAFLVCVTASVVIVGYWTPLTLSLLVRRVRRGTMRLAVANVVRQPGRSGVVAVAVAASVGVAFMTASYDVSIHDGIAHGVLSGSTGHSVLVTTVADNSADNADARIPMSAVTALARLPGVARVELYDVAVSGNRPANLVLAETATDFSSAPTVIEGRPDLASYRAGEVMVGPGLARRDHLGPGSALRLDTPTGLVALTVQAVWHNGDFGGDNMTMTPARFGAVFGPQLPSALWLVAAPGFDVGRLRAEAAAAQLAPDLVYSTPQQLIARSSSSATSQLAPFWALQRALLLVAFVSVLSTLLLAGLQRRRELGLLAAAGLTPGEQFGVVVSEGLLVSATASGFGVVLGVVGMASLVLVTPLLVGYQDPYRLDLVAVALYVPVAVAVAMAASLWPAWRASRLAVVEALQYE